MFGRRPSVLLAALSAATLIGSTGATAAPVEPAPANPAGAAAGRDCHPIKTDARFRGGLSDPVDVLGFELGEQAVTVRESNRLLTMWAKQSPRVVSGTLATSWEGRELKYAIVGRAGHVTPRGLARIRAATARLRDPDTSRREAMRLAYRTPPILWVAGNVHGNEESGADSALKTLYNLAARTDCAARRIMDNALVVVLPIQNPDGRAADRRQNMYGFDLNRDWFARTQPETDGKVALLQKYPPAVFIDAHEMGGTGFFFPPNADPIYHEITDTSLGWMEIYGSAMAAEFRRQGFDFFQREVYDLFYQGYGDTVPTTGFLGAGMTFEKGGDSPIGVRTYEQFVTQWITLSAAADRADKIMRGWHASYVESYEQGAQGRLAPNEVINPENEVINEVPDRLVRHYFLRAGGPAKQAQVQEIVRHLQRMNVTVHRLTEPLRVPDYKPYGRTVRATTLPAGTYWVPMAQAQKHWIQAMLNEDTYTPFPFFYDVTAWSLPLLGDVQGGSAGATLSPEATRVPLMAEPAAPELPAQVPTVGVLELSDDWVQSIGWLRYRLDQEWGIDHRTVTPQGVADGGLDGLDVLLVPDGPSEDGYEALGEGGRDALRAWVNEGGRYIGWSGGAELAAMTGVTTAVLDAPTSDVPGSLFRVQVDEDAPMAAGVGAYAWQFYAYDNVMRASDPDDVVVSYPQPESNDWFVSGFARGAEELGGTAAAISEPVGDGRAVVFASDPNFRAYTDGTATLLRNAILQPGQAAGSAAAGAAQRADAENMARDAARMLPDLREPIRVSVRPGSAEETTAALRDLGASWVEQRSAGKVTFLLRNPRGLSSDQHPWARRLPSKLQAAGVQPIAVTLPS
ncbi:MAG TPA: M14 family zinc carboxypeptidase [Nocardioidaceae bacterium]|nr:M14 family zinc carboxypeptidase [Nocardioidaceae bacterium]